MKSPDQKTVLLDDGSKVILVDTLGKRDIPDHDASNNIYRVSPSGEIVWQIDAGEGVDGRAPFTSLRIDEHGRLIAFRWDGSDFAVDIETGAATFVDFPK